MRLLVAILGGALGAAAALPVPALAREAHGGQVAEALANPGTQQAMAGAMAAMTEALLDLKVGPFAKAMEGMDDSAGHRKAARRIDPDATLGDLAGPEARRMPREVSRKLPKMMGAMAGMAGAMEAMLPQLEAMGAKVKDAMGQSNGDADGDYGGDRPAGEASEE
jgi:hypothetical protein